MSFWNRFRAAFAATPIQKRIGRASLWLLAGSAVGHVLGVISGILAARILGRVEFGKLGILRSSIDMLTLVAGLGLGVTACKHVAEFRSRVPERAGRVIGFTGRVAWLSGSVFAIALCVHAGWFARVLGAPELVAELRIAAVALLFSTVSGVYSGVLGGFEAFREQARIQMTVGLIAPPAVLIGVLTDGLRGAMTGYGLTSFASLWLSRRAVLAKVRQNGIAVDTALNRGEVSILLRFALPALLSGLTITPVLWAGNTILARAPGGYWELGLIGAGQHWRQAVLFIPITVGTAVLPILANLYGEKDEAAYQEAFGTGLLVNLTATLPVAVLIVVMSPLILRLYGRQFAAGELVLVLFVLAGTLQAISAVGGQVLMSRGKAWLALCLNLGWACVFLGTAALLCPRFGAIGLASAYLLSYLSHFLLSVLAVWKLLVPHRGLASLPNRSPGGRSSS